MSNKTKNYLNVKIGDLPTFNDLTYSATTIILTLDQDIDYHMFYKKIPIVDIELVPGTENRKKIELAYVKLGTPGTIFSAKYKTRQITKNKGFNRTGKDGMGNALTCDIHLKEKNINFKIMRNKVHITGCKKDAHVAELFRYITFYIKHFMEDGVYVCEKMPTIIEVNRALIKMDYNIGFCIDREKLIECLNDIETDFTSFYDPGIFQSVILRHPIMDKKNKDRRKTSTDYDIRVGYNGGILFCGNDYVEMAKIYVKFNSLLLSIKEDIELDFDE